MSFMPIRSNIPQIEGLLNRKSKVDPAMYYEYSYSGPADQAGQFFDSEKDENYITINVEDDIDVDDISLTLSAHDTTLTVEISKENDNGESFHLKKKYSRNNKFDPQKMNCIPIRRKVSNLCSCCRKEHRKENSSYYKEEVKKTQEG